MYDPTYSETLFDWIPSGAFETTPATAQALKDRQAGNAARWYQAALPRVRPLIRARQLGEPCSGDPRQFGESECGMDGTGPRREPNRP